jgi:hypothetical protein
MQFAGKSCCVCGQSIVLDGEGSLCAGCGALAHRSCVEHPGAQCPQCQAVWQEGRHAPVYALRCPACGRPNDAPPRANCPACHALLEFDSEAERARERRRVHRAGVGQLAGGLVWWAIAAALVWFWFRNNVQPPDEWSVDLRLWSFLWLPYSVVFATVAGFRGMYLLWRAHLNLRFR